MAGNALQNIEKLGLPLPQPVAPVAAYVPYVQTGNLVYISGQVPFRDGELMATGPVPSQVTPEACCSTTKSYIFAEYESSGRRLRASVASHRVCSLMDWSASTDDASEYMTT